MSAGATNATLILQTLVYVFNHLSEFNLTAEASSSSNFYPNNYTSRVTGIITAASTLVISIASGLILMIQWVKNRRLG